MTGDSKKDNAIEQFAVTLPRRCAPELAVSSPPEIAQAIGSKIIKALPLQHNSDSFIISLETESAGDWIYKAKCGPEIEPRFYRETSSGLLPEYKIIREEEFRYEILLRKISLPPLTETRGGDLPHLMETIASAVAELDAPVFLNLSTPEKWRGFCEVWLHRLGEMKSENLFPDCEDSVIKLLANLCQDARLDEAFADNVGFIHGDLHPANVFTNGQGGLQVIDWQMPLAAPRAFDRACLLERMGVKIEDFFGAPEIIGMKLTRLCCCLLTAWCLPVIDVARNDRYVFSLASDIISVATKSGFTIK